MILRIILCAWGVAMLAVTTSIPVHNIQAQDNEPRLGQRTDSFREAWLFGTSGEAMERLSVFEGTSEWVGETEKWPDALKLTLLLEQDKGPEAEALALRWISPDDAPLRDSVRVLRLLWAFGRLDIATKILAEAKIKHPNSSALSRWSAGLAWVAGDHAGAIDQYVAHIASMPEATEYPYSGQVADSDVLWPDLAVKNADDKSKSKSKSGKLVEPFESPFGFAGGSDLPGMDFCIAKMSEDRLLMARSKAKLADCRTAAERTREAMQSYRGGDAEERTRLQIDAVTANWNLRIHTRVVVMNMLETNNLDGCEGLLLDALAEAQRDLPLLTLLARYYMVTAQPEKSRKGPLKTLRSLGHELGANAASQLTSEGVRQSMDLVLKPALLLYRKDKEAGLRELDTMRTTFGPERQKNVISDATMGVWLALNDEWELAEPYLRRGATAINDPKQAYDAIPASIALAKLETERFPTLEDTNERLKIANFLITLSAYARLSGYQGTQLVEQCGDVNIWSRSTARFDVRPLAELLGKEDLAELLVNGLPGWLASQLKPDEQKALTDPKSEDNRILNESIETFAKNVNEYRASDNWRVGRTIRDTMASVFVAMERKQILARTELCQKSEMTLDEFKEWWSTHEAFWALYTRFGGSRDDDEKAIAHQRKEWNIPEVLAQGIVNDAADLLIQGGHFDDAFRLMYANRGIAYEPKEVPYQRILLWLLASKQSDNVQRLLVESAIAQQSTSFAALISSSQWERVSGVIERLGDDTTLDSLFRIGVLTPTTDDDFFEQVPDAKNWPSEYWVRGGMRAELRRQFANFASYRRSSTFLANMDEYLQTGQERTPLQRALLFVLATEYPLNDNSYNGLRMAHDQTRLLGVLDDWYKAQSALGDERAAKHYARMKPLHEIGQK